MRLFLGSLLLFAASPAFAEIKCVAEQFRATQQGIKDHVVQELTAEQDDPVALVLSAKINGRAYSLTGNPQKGDFHAIQSWGKDYTSGIISAATFNSVGRLVISQVEGEQVYKLVCTRD